MQVNVPAELKASVPPTFFGKVLAVTPVVMAVVATMLAGLSSSEMTRAQYDRSLAAQQQSKAGDQWSFFQAKRLRGAYQRNTAELLQTLAEVHPIDPAALRAAAGDDAKVAALLDSAAGAQAVAMLQKGELPTTRPAAELDAKVKAALDGMERMKSDAEMAALLAPVSDQMLVTALHAALDQTEALDAATGPVNTIVDRLDAVLSRPTTNPASGAAGGRTAARDFASARLRYTANRYDTEARLNQAIANLFELQVRKSNFSAERHHERSQRFFYGMLGAQLGVIVSTLAMAARKRNLLWSVAAAAGLLAITFAAYVFLFV